MWLRKGLGLPFRLKPNRWTEPIKNASRSPLREFVKRKWQSGKNSRILKATFKPVRLKILPEGKYRFPTRRCFNRLLYWGLQSKMNLASGLDFEIARRIGIAIIISPSQLGILITKTSFRGICDGRSLRFDFNPNFTSG